MAGYIKRRTKLRRRIKGWLKQKIVCAPRTAYLVENVPEIDGFDYMWEKSRGKLLKHMEAMSKAKKYKIFDEWKMIEGHYDELSPCPLAKKVEYFEKMFPELTTKEAINRRKKELDLWFHI